LPGEAAEHSGQLGETDGGGEPFRGKSMRREIDGAGEGKSGASALQQPAAFRRANRAKAEQGAAGGGGEDADHNWVVGAEAVERSAGHDRETGVGVKVKPQKRTDAKRRQAEGAGQLRYHHAGRGAQRILQKIENQTEPPCGKIGSALGEGGRRRLRSDWRQRYDGRGG
jgi:hypothetical protein